MKINKEKKVKLDIAIAYFLGWRIDNSYPDKDKVWKKGNFVELDTTFKFSTDWNLTMEVFRAVNKLDGYTCVFSGTTCQILKDDEVLWEVKSDNNLQEAVYACLGEFIVVYNEKKCC